MARVQMTAAGAIESFETVPGRSSTVPDQQNEEAPMFVGDCVVSAMFMRAMVAVSEQNTAEYGGG